MNRNGSTRLITQTRCAIYTRKSTEEGLEQEFNSLDAQREAGEAYVASQKAEGWVALPHRYDDGGYTGGNMDRPALAKLLADIQTGLIDCVVVYKVDRLSRSLMDFARMMETFEKHKISFVSVTQQFNTTHSMGRLTLNILLSFAQFEREIISERTRDKIAAARRKGKWSGGHPLLGYDLAPQTRKLVVNEDEAKRVRAIFELYLERQSLIQTSAALNKRGWTTKAWTNSRGVARGGRPFDKCNLFSMLTNVIYLGKVRYKEEVHPGEHAAILDEDIWHRAQQMLRSNGRTGGMHIRNKYGALLKGLIHCIPCQTAMSHSYTLKEKGKTAYRYYVCGRALKRGWEACPSKSLPAQQIEQFVVERIKAIGTDPALKAATLEQARTRATAATAAFEAERAAVERELRLRHAEIRRVAADAGGNGHVAARLADLNEAIRVGEARRAELVADIDRAASARVNKATLDAALRKFDGLWATLSPSEQAHLLHLLIQRIDYDGAKGSVAITFHPTGIQSLGMQATVDKETKPCRKA